MVSLYSTLSELNVAKSMSRLGLEGRELRRVIRAPFRTDGTPRASESSGMSPAGLEGSLHWRITVVESKHVQE